MIISKVGEKYSDSFMTNRISVLHLVRVSLFLIDVAEISISAGNILYIICI